MNYTISINNKKVEWSEDTLKQKLENLGNLAGKKVAWIKEDLTIKKSNWLTRLVWTVVAKHFAWMRRTFYGVNLNVSSSILQQVSKEAAKNFKLIEVYNRAVTKFKEVAPRHAKLLELIKAKEEVLRMDTSRHQQKPTFSYPPAKKPRLVGNDISDQNQQQPSSMSDDGELMEIEDDFGLKDSESDMDISVGDCSSDEDMNDVLDDLLIG